MSNQIVKTIFRNNMYYHLLPSKKFKTITIVVKIKAALERETVTKRALLPFLLRQGTKSYPSEQQLMQKLDELYGAKLHLDCSKKGTNHIIHLQLDFANERFIEGEKMIVQEALQLLQDIIFSPLIENGSFRKDIVEAEKRKLTNKVNALKDNKLLYANQRLIDHMYADEAFSLHKDGYIEDLPAIDENNLYEYYEQMLKNDRFDIYVVGDFDATEMEQKLTAYLVRDVWNERDASQSVINKNVEPKKIAEKDEIQQAKLHIGYRTNCTFSDEKYGALQVFNGLFGGYASSRLFIHVREKNSLAYYIASRLESHQGLMLVYSGIEASDAQKTIDIIETQRQELINGNFTEEEMEETKNLLISNLYETLDQQSSTVELFYQQILAGMNLPIEKYVAEISNVTKEDVCAIAKNIELDTIYLLSNKEGVLS